MTDPYEKVWDSIAAAFKSHTKAIIWIAERTLSAKDYKEFVDEFVKKPKDDHDDLLDFIRKKGR